MWEELAGGLLAAPGAAVTGVGGLLGNIRDAVALESQRKVAGVALKMMFTSVNDMLIDEENTPRSLQETVDGMLTNVRLSVVEGMKGQSAAAALIQDHLAMRATGWLSPEAGLYHNLRCRVLYYLSPADETTWWVLSHRWAKLLIPLFFVGFAGINVWFFILLYLLHDTRDEYQLCRFLTQFKLFQYLFTGVLPLAFFFYRLLRAQTLYDPELGSGYDPEMAEDVASWHFHAPALPWEWMEWAAVIARMVVVLDGFVRLKCCANGGPEQLEALEAIRMDGADGQLDGVVDAHHQTVNLTATKVGRRGDVSHERQATPWLWRQGVDPARPQPGRHHEAKLWAEYTERYRFRREKAREEGLDVRVCNGGAVMQGLFAWEILTLALSAALVGGVIGSMEYSTDQWRFWMFCELGVAVHSLLAFPYMLFIFAPIEYAVGAAKTGYDRHGWLCQHLTMDEVRQCRKAYADARERKGVTRQQGIFDYNKRGKDNKRDLAVLIG